MQNKIEIYQTEDNETRVEVRLEKDTVWLSQEQMSVLFQRERSVITKHINNIFKEGELEETSNVQILHISGSDKPVKFFNLDVIISLGYRVKSKRGIQFRIWANKILKEYLVQGYTLNKGVLERELEKARSLRDAVRLISYATLNAAGSQEDKNTFLLLLEKYSLALGVLDDYDFGHIREIRHDNIEAYILSYQEVKAVIEKIKKDIGGSELFGREKDDSLKSSISAIYQTFDGEGLYKSIMEMSVNLLYFIVKNHSFVDGNKRIAASIFIYFLQKNNYLERVNIDNSLLAALTLLIANSRPEERKLIVNISSVILTME